MTLTIPDISDEWLERLRHQAAARDMTVEELAREEIGRLAARPVPTEAEDRGTSLSESLSWFIGSRQPDPALDEALAEFSKPHPRDDESVAQVIKDLG